jgi:hypothetical protein
MLKLCSIVFVKIKMKHCDYVKPTFDIIDAHNGYIYAKSFEDNHNIFGFVLPIINETKNISPSHS